MQFHEDCWGKLYPSLSQQSKDGKAVSREQFESPATRKLFPSNIAYVAMCLAAVRFGGGPGFGPDEPSPS